VSRGLVAENTRLRAALQKIVDESTRRHAEYEPDGRGLTDLGKSWRDGYSTATAHWSLVATEALDPVEWAAHEELWLAGSCDSDREWFARTGNCGHCGDPPRRCSCTPDDPCGCGPHQVDPWPRTCWVCSGSGLIEQHRKVTS
jgi:hypothetical protein